MTEADSICQNTSPNFAQHTASSMQKTTPVKVKSGSEKGANPPRKPIPARISSTTHQLSHSIEMNGQWQRPGAKDLHQSRNLANMNMRNGRIDDKMEYDKLERERIKRTQKQFSLNRSPPPKIEIRNGPNRIVQPRPIRENYQATKQSQYVRGNGARPRIDSGRTINYTARNESQKNSDSRVFQNDRTRNITSQQNRSNTGRNTSVRANSPNQIPSHNLEKDQAPNSASQGVKETEKPEESEEFEKPEAAEESENLETLNKSKPRREPKRPQDEEDVKEPQESVSIQNAEESEESQSSEDWSDTGSRDRRDLYSSKVQQTRPGQSKNNSIVTRAVNGVQHGIYKFMGGPGNTVPGGHYRQVVTQHNYYLQQYQRTSVENEKLTTDLRRMKQKLERVEGDLQVIQSNYSAGITKDTWSPLEDDFVRSSLEQIHADIEEWALENCINDLQEMIQLPAEHSDKIWNDAIKTFSFDSTLPFTFEEQIESWTTSDIDPSLIAAALIVHHMYHNVVENVFFIAGLFAESTNPKVENSFVLSMRSTYESLSQCEPKFIQVFDSKLNPL
jgi:hypothetical protein